MNFIRIMCSEFTRVKLQPVAFLLTWINFNPNMDK